MKENKKPISRFFEGDLRVEKRADGTPSRKIIGYAAVFNKWSHNLGWFREKIDPAAFNNVLDHDVVALFNHDRNQVLARNNVTLKLSVDSVGLKYEFEAPESPMGDNVLKAVERGDVRGSSFQFIPKSTKWEKSPEADVEEDRTILEIEQLIDVGPVTFPAYPDTTADKRDHEAFYKEQGSANTWNSTELRERELKLYQ